MVTLIMRKQRRTQSCSSIIRFHLQCCKVSPDVDHNQVTIAALMFVTGDAWSGPGADVTGDQDDGLTSLTRRLTGRPGSGAGSCELSSSRLSS